MTDHDVVGTELPGGSYTVKRWMSFLWADATRNPDDAYRYPDGDDGGGDDVYVPHDFATQIAVAGSGASIEGILGEMGMDWESGVFYAGQDLSFEQPLRSGVEYQVTGEISDVVEKAGESGPFHLVTITYHAHDGDGEPVFDSDMTIIVR